MPLKVIPICSCKGSLGLSSGLPEKIPEHSLWTFPTKSHRLIPRATQERASPSAWAVGGGLSSILTVIAMDWRKSGRYGRFSPRGPLNSSQARIGPPWSDLRPRHRARTVGST